MGAGFSDQDYVQAGAQLVSNAAIAWSSQMVVKVKEPQPSEYKYFRSDLILFTYLHLAAERQLTEALVNCGTTAIAYETVASPDC